MQSSTCTITQDSFVCIAQGGASSLPTTCRSNERATEHASRCTVDWGAMGRANCCPIFSASLNVNRVFSVEPLPSDLRHVASVYDLFFSLLFLFLSSFVFRLSNVAHGQRQGVD
jgi:hypothetical protein